MDSDIGKSGKKGKLISFSCVNYGACIANFN